MKISDVFANKEIVEKAVISCFSGALGSDVKGYFGTSFEIELMNKFNYSQKDYKLLTLKALKELVERVGVTIDFNGFCDSIDDLDKRVKKSDDIFSMTDILLFKQQDDRFQLVDWSSCKTSHRQGGNKIAIHNDPDGFIHDALLGNHQPLKNIGKISMVFYDENGWSSFSYDGDYVKLSKEMHLVKENNGGCEYVVNGIKCGKQGRQQITTVNRKKKTTGTSFARGIKFDRELIEKWSVFDNVANGTINKLLVEEAFQNRIGL